MTRTLAAASLLALAAGCQRDDGIVAGEPHLDPPPSHLDFGEVKVGVAATLRLRLHNQGLGDLSLATRLEPEDGDIRLVDHPEVVEGRGAAEVVLRYVPGEEGPDAAALVLDSDDPHLPSLRLDVSGLGVVPLLDIAPSTLWFGDVAPGGSASHIATLASRGSGPVTLSNLVFPGAEADAYSWSLPTDVALPFRLDPGHAVALEITCAPAGEPPSGELVVVSDDAEDTHQVIRLLGAGGESLPPEVEFTAPTWGSAWLTTEAVEAVVHAVDPDDPPAALSVRVVLDGSPVGTAVPDSTGVAAFTLEGLAPGVHLLKAQAIDPDDGVGSDELEIAVHDARAPLVYTISGGESVYTWWAVDDDVEITVDGVSAFSDADGHQSTHPPVEIEAEVGSVVEVVATDVNPTRKALSDLVLHFGTERSQLLVPGESASSNPADADYDPTYAGPWPNDFVDIEVEVEVP